MAKMDVKNFIKDLNSRNLYSSSQERPTKPAYNGIDRPMAKTPTATQVTPGAWQTSTFRKLTRRSNGMV